MAGPVDHLATVGEVVEELRGLGLEPVLVGAWPWWYWDLVE
jgi:hypothetical protein